MANHGRSDLIDSSNEELLNDGIAGIQFLFFAGFLSTTYAVPWRFQFSRGQASSFRGYGTLRVEIFRKHSVHVYLSMHYTSI